MIRKRKDGWYVLSKTGKKLGGPYKRKERAQTRLNEVHYFSHVPLSRRKQKSKKR